jgi:hypothetical protein
LALFSVLAFLGAGSIGCGEDGVTPNDNGGDDGNGGPLPDTIAPASVTDLRQRTPTYETIALAWTAPGDDGSIGTADRYDIRHSESLITEENWDVATPLDPDIVLTPKPSGQIETIVVTKLQSSTQYYFALKTTDEKDNESDLSNNASGSTGAESFPPADVLDLAALATSESSFELTWTAPGDDYMKGTATRYDIRYSLRAIVSQADFAGAIKAEVTPTPKPAGETETFEITGLTGINYYFVLRTADELDNWSGLSNGAPGLGFNEYLWVTPTLVQVGNEALIRFRASPSGITRVAFHSYTLSGVCGDRELEALVWETLPEGVYTTVFDFFDNDTNDYYEPRYYSISVCWGSEMKQWLTVILDS